MLKRLTPILLFIIFCVSACGAPVTAPPATAPASDTPALQTEQTALPTPDTAESPAASAKPGSGTPKGTSEPVSIEALTPELQDYILGFTEEYKGLTQEGFNVLFSGTASEDLDGDGKAESIELTPVAGETAEDNNTTYYPGVKVNISGIEQTLVLDKPFCPIGKAEAPGKIDGYIVDVLKGDGRKELLVYFQWITADIGTPFSYARLFQYDKGALNMITLDCNIDFPDYPINGTGYIAYEKFIQDDSFKTLDPETMRRGIMVYGMKKIDQTGAALEEAALSRYVPAYYGDLHTFWDGQYASAQWQQALSPKPGAPPTKSIAKKANMKIGLYDASGWIQVLNINRKELGWVDLRKVDINALTKNYYIYEL